MQKRTISRIKVLTRLYQYDLLKNDDYVDEFDKLLEEVKDDESIAYDEDFYLTLYNGIMKNINTIDRTIAISLTNYPLDRLGFVDRNLLRIGTYELLFTDTPKEVIINEIVEITKMYSQTEDFKSGSFNNAVLDKISKRISK